MRNLTTLIIAFIFSSLSLSAQSYEGKVDYQKKETRAIVIDYPYPPSVVENAIEQKLERLGMKKKESKGFMVFKNAVITDISREAADYVFRVERKSRRDRDESTIYLLITRNDENIIERSDALVNSNSKTFLNRLGPDIEAYSLELEIKEQEEAIAKVEKKLKNLKEDQESMEKRVRNLQGDLKDNENEQNRTAKDMEKEMELLEVLKNKRQN